MERRYEVDSMRNKGVTLRFCSRSWKIKYKEEDDARRQTKC